METPLAIGHAIVFQRPFQDYLCAVQYAVVAIHKTQYIVVELDKHRHESAKNVRALERTKFIDLRHTGSVQVTPLPALERRRSAGTTSGSISAGLPPTLSKDATQRKCALAPLFERRVEILSANVPWKRCNDVAAAAGLNITRVRALFFRWAAYHFDDRALEPLRGRPPKSAVEGVAAIGKKPGPKIANPQTTPEGWPFDPAWVARIEAGWRKYAVAPTTRHKVHTQTLVHLFGCTVDTTRKPERIFSPNGSSFPNERQFARHIKRKLGVKAYEEGLKGVYTVRNHPKSKPDTVQQHVTNLLQEVHWDAQVLAELPGDLLDSTKPGKPIIRVVATCAAAGGDVGVGYDYGNESRWAYLMALLSMCMPKSEFCALFGVEVFDDDWPAIGVMMKVRGDRGPAIAQQVQDIASDILGIHQEWSASYDPIGKALAEAAHHKQPVPEGPKKRQSIYRTPIEIIRDDLRKTVTRFRSADMSHRIESFEQAKRIGAGTPLTIWNDLRRRGLYVGQLFPIETVIPHTMPRHEVSITKDGVHLGALRYLSEELKNSTLLERGTLTGYAYALNMVTKDIWLEYSGGLMRLTAVPIRANAAGAAHSMTIEESFKYATFLRASQRESEQLQKALEIRNEIDATDDRKAVASFQKGIAAEQATSRKETIRQHRHVLIRKR